VPDLIGTAVSSKLATLNELQTVYGVLDLYDLIDILTVDNYNRILANDK